MQTFKAQGPRQKAAFGSRSASVAWGSFVAAASTGDVSIEAPELLSDLQMAEVVAFRTDPCKSSSAQYPVVTLQAVSDDSRDLLAAHGDKLAALFKRFVGEFMLDLEFVGPSARSEWGLGVADRRSPLALDLSLRPGPHHPPKHDHFAKVHYRHPFRHVRWEPSETHGPQAGEGRRVAYWCSPALSTFLDGPSARGWSLDNFLFASTGRHIDRRRGWHADDWGSIDPTAHENRIKLRLVGPTNGDTSSDVGAILSAVEDHFDVSRSQHVRDKARPAALAEQVATTAPEIDVVLIFRGGGLGASDYLDAGAAALRQAAADVHARGTSVVIGVGHGSAGRHPDRRPADGRVLAPDPPFGLHELATPSSAALWLVKNFVGVRRSAELGQQHPGLGAESRAWWEQLPRR